MINPVGVSRAAAWGDRSTGAWRREIASTVGMATAVLTSLGLLTKPILDLIDVSTPTFRLSAALVMGVTALLWFIRPSKPIEALDDEGSTLVTLGVTMLLTPGPVFAAMAANGDAGVVAGIVAVVVAGTLTGAALLVRRPTDPVGQWAAQMIGAGALLTADSDRSRRRPHRLRVRAEVSRRAARASRSHGPR